MRVLRRASETPTIQPPPPIPLPDLLAKVTKVFGLCPKPTLSLEEQQFECFEAVFQSLQKREWTRLAPCSKELCQLTDRKGRSLLIRALELEPYDPELTLALVTRKIALARLDATDNTPLHHAARIGDLPAIELLYSSTSAIKRNQAHETPLEVAVREHQIDAIKKLLTLPQLRVETPLWASFFSLGNRYFLEDNFSHAIEMYLEALKVANRVFTEGAGNQIRDTWRNLASCYFNLNNPETALFYLEQAFHLFAETPGCTSLEEIELLKPIALCYACKGNLARALTLNDQAAQLLTKVNERDLLAAEVEILDNKGLCYFYDQSYRAAIELHEQALTTLILLSNEDHPLLIDCHGHLAACYEKLEQYDRAKDHWAQALKLATKIYGSEHRTTKSIQKKAQ